MRMSALEEMMDKQKLMRMTERSERMYLRARAGGMLGAQQGLSSIGAGCRGHEGRAASSLWGPGLHRTGTAPHIADSAGATGVLITPGGGILQTTGAAGEGPLGRQAGPQQVRVDVREGAAGRGAGYFRVTGASALGRTGARQEGTASPPTPWLHRPLLAGLGCGHAALGADTLEMGLDPAGAATLA